MTFGIQVLDYVVLQLMWICHIIYDTITSIGKRQEDKTEETKTTPSNVENMKRHFIHLYTTTSSLKNGRPVCYMDVYEILSPSDEQRLRKASSKGIPNKTYLKYHQKNVDRENDLSQAWLEYSTLAL